MIVAPQPEAVEAGAAVLAAGGNAHGRHARLRADAGRGGPDDVRHRRARRDARCTTHDWHAGGLRRPVHLPRRRRMPTMWANLFERECSDGYGFVLRGAVNEIGRSAVTVPGILRRWPMRMRRMGRMPWSRPVRWRDRPARGWLDGPPACPRHVQRWTRPPMAAVEYVREAGTSPRMARALYLRADGTPKRPGDASCNPELAATLARHRARGGAEAFYTGEIARRIAADMAAHGGLVTEADLAAVRSRRVAPLRVPYRGYAVPAAAARRRRRWSARCCASSSVSTCRPWATTAPPMIARAGRGDEDRRHRQGRRMSATPTSCRCRSICCCPMPMPLRAPRASARGERATLTRVGAEPKGTTTISCVDADGHGGDADAHARHALRRRSRRARGFMLNGAMNWYDPRPGPAGLHRAGQAALSPPCRR